jgi:hypothetical protein
VPSQTKTTNFNDLAMRSLLYCSHTRRYKRRPAAGQPTAGFPRESASAVTIVSVAFWESLH